MRARGLQHAIAELDLDGLFDHVWLVHPLLGAGAGQPLCGPARTTPVSSRHSVIEAPIGRLRALRRLPVANLLLAQCLLFIRLSWLLRRRRVSAVAVADPFYLGLWGLALVAVHRIPLVVKANSNYDTAYESVGSVAYPRLIRWRWLEVLIARCVLSRANLVTVGSDDNLRYVTRHGAPRDRVAVVPTGDMIASDHMQPPGQRPSVATELDLVDRPFIVFVGRLEPLKDPDAAVLALARLKPALPQTALVVIGDGSMRAQLELQCRELGISEDVRFTGTRDQAWIARTLSSAAVVICPYSGLALVEAALSATPVVGYDIEWHAELIESGETGILVPYRDTDALVRAVEMLLRDPERGRVMGEAARVRALEEMDRDAAVAIKRSIYSALLASNDEARRQRTGRRVPKRARRPLLRFHRGRGSG